MAIAYAATLRNSMLDAITTLAGASALLRIYDGTRPATGGTATTLLAELTCNATFAPGAAAGVLTLNARIRAPIRRALQRGFASSRATAQPMCLMATSARRAAT